MNSDGRENKLYNLIQGTIDELGLSTQRFEEIIDKMSNMPELDGQPQLINEGWQNVDHLTNLKVNLEEMAQLEKGLVELNYEEVDMAQLIAEVTSTMASFARSKNLELRHHVAKGLPPLPADPVRLRQVLLHVLSNAIKFTKQGVIEVSAEVVDDDLMLIISDTGVGIPSDDLKPIFQKFGRGSNSDAETQQGAGLGLAISRYLVELHGGNIWGTSVVDIGSTFHITLPLNPAIETATDTGATLASAAIPIEELAQTITTAEEDDTIADDVLEPLLAPGPTPSLKVKKGPIGPRLAQDDDDGETRPMPDEHKRTLGPVARFSPTYIKRFGFSLLAGLLVVAVLVGVLAITNGPIEQVDEEAIASVLNPPETPTLASLQSAPEAGGEGVDSMTAMPTEEPLPTATSLVVSLGPTNTPTVAPTTLPTEQVALPEPPTETPTFEPTATASPVLAPTETPSPTATDAPTNTPSPTATAAPTETPSPTATMLPTNTPAAQATTSATVVATATRATTPASGAVPAAVVNEPPSRLSFGVGNGNSQLIAIRDLDDASENSLMLDETATNNSRLSWSPSGDLAFVSDREGSRDIFLTDESGDAVINLTADSDGDDLQPAWSPDGSRIAFTSGRGGNFDIYVMDADGDNITQLTTSRGFDEWPAWSPDGSQIAFVSDRDGNVDVYVMNADGSNQRQITDNPAADWPAVWSPDGEMLLFSSERNGNWNLFLTDVTTGVTTRLTNAITDERNPVWSPDGSQIAFTVNNGDNADVYTFAAPNPDDGLREVAVGTWSRVTDTEGDEQFPSWVQ